MSTPADNTKRVIWRCILVVGLLTELVLIAVAVVSLTQGNEEFPFKQAMFFLAIGIWIYIAYLKQRTEDVSKFVVDEKIKTHALLENLQDGVILVDPANRVITANSKASEITGIPAIEFLGKNISDEVDSETKNMLISRQEGESEGSITATGRKVRFKSLLIPGEADNSGYRIVYVYAPAKPSQVAPTDSTACGLSVARIANLVEGMKQELIGILRQPTTNPQSRAVLSNLVVRATAESLMLSLAAVRTMLEQKTLASSLKRAPVQVKALMDTACRDILPVALAGEVKLDMPTGSAADLAMNADLELLTIAMRQIIYNAVLESIPGKTIVVRAMQMGADIGLVVIDKGPTVARELLSHLYDDPYKGVVLNTGAAIRYEGTGCRPARDIIEAHGGTLTLDSPSDGGLRVTIMLPA